MFAKLPDIVTSLGISSTRFKFFHAATKFCCPVEMRSLNLGKVGPFENGKLVRSRMAYSVKDRLGRAAVIWELATVVQTNRR